MHRAATLLAAAAVLAAAAGCSSAEDGTDATGRTMNTATASSSPAATPTDAGEDGLGTPDPVETTAAAAGPETFKMGERGTISNDEVGDVLFITVAQPRTVRDEYIKAERGRYLAVTVTYEAVAEAQDANPYDLVAITTSGERITPTFGPDVKPAQLNAVTLNNGEKVTGTVVFDVPTKGVTGIAYGPAGQILGTWKL